MSAVLLTFPTGERPPVLIAAEILLQDGKLKRLMSLGRDLTDAEDRAWGELEDEISDLRDELRSRIKALTGVAWDDLYEALA